MRRQPVAWAFGTTARLTTWSGLQGLIPDIFNWLTRGSNALPLAIRSANVSCCKYCSIVNCAVGAHRVLVAGSQSRLLASRAIATASAETGQGRNTISQERKTAELVKRLRERTSVSVGLCKQALEASNWDIEEAVRHLREAGIARATKAALREAHEGFVALCSLNGGTSWNAVILNCETDFVQQSCKFVAFAKALARHCAALPSVGGVPSGYLACATSLLKASKPSAELSSLAQSGNGTEFNTVQDQIAFLASQFGEKIDVSAVERLESSACSCIGAYVHSEVEAGVGRMAALVEISYRFSKSSKATEKLCRLLRDFARLLAVQVVAAKPKFISLESIPSEYVEQERAHIERVAAKRTLLAPARGSNIIDLSNAVDVEKELNESLREQSLLAQEFLMMPQLHRDILGDVYRKSEASDPVQSRHYFTVKDAVLLVGSRMGCKLEVTRMKLLTVGSR